MATYEIVKLTSELLSKGLDVLRDGFFPDESVCKCVNLLTDSPRVQPSGSYVCSEASVELERLSAECFKDNVSLVAVDLLTKEVIGVAINKIQVKPPPGEVSFFEKFAADNIKTASALALVDYMVQVDKKLDLFEYFNSHCSLELMFLAVKKNSRGRGIAQKLIEETIKVAENYQGCPKMDFVSAIFTSRFSVHVGAAAGMSHLVEIPFSEFQYKGRKFSEALGNEHPFCTLSAIRISR